MRYNFHNHGHKMHNYPKVVDADSQRQQQNVKSRTKWCYW